MGIFHRKPEDVQQFVDAGSNARKNWSKYKETGKPKFKERAKRSYDEQKALTIKMSNPATKIENKTLTVKDSFKKTKSIKVSAKANVSVKSSKKSKK